MVKKMGKTLLALCLSFFMAFSFVPTNSFIPAYVLAAQDNKSEVYDMYDTNEVYNMYRDGSGKNIKPREQSIYDIGEDEEEKEQEERDTIQAIGGMTIAEPGLEMIKSFESCRLTAYKVLATEQYWTIGWGHYGPDVYEGMKITQAQADAYLKSDVSRFSGYVNNFSKTNKVNLNQNQFDALVSFTYNVGTRWMSASTIRTYLLNGIEKYTDAQIENAFGLWNTSGGQVLAGLTRRRKAEAQLFLSKVASLPPTISNHTIPKTVREGSSFNVAGYITSDSILREVSVGVYKNGVLMTGKTVVPNARTYSLANLDNYVVFGKLAAGSYQYVVSAMNTTAKVKLIDEKFEVLSAHTHSYKTTTSKAKPNVNGSIVVKCGTCGQISKKTTIYAPVTMNLSTTVYTYKGNAKKPAVKIIDAKGAVISSSNYTVSYPRGRTNVGTYKVTVKFKGSKYSGSLSKTFTINPAKVTLKSATSKSSGKMTAKWTANTKATGYQIKYSQKSNFADSKKVTVTGRKTLSKTISGMKKGKKYYVKVRVYQKVNGVKYYSSYSNVKAVTIRK